MPAYAIRQKSTGFFIPQFPKGTRKGGTWLEPADPNKKPPRLFIRKQDAKVALDHWLKGRLLYVDNSFNFDPCEGIPDPELKRIPQAHRKANDMEICVITLTAVPIE